MSLAQRYQQVLSRIQSAESNHSGSSQHVTLLAVSKTHSINKINELYHLGQRDFGENYLQEALDKISQLTELAICWHYIGPIQSNKTRAIAQNFDWVQTIERLKIAKRLNDQRPNDLDKLNVCIQVNISAEQNKSGIEPDQVMDLAQDLVKLPNLRLRGLMCIAQNTQEHTVLSNQFTQMLSLFKQLQTKYPDIDTLSMGMSQDLELAIANGSTMVRIGTDIFGPRQQ